MDIHRGLLGAHRRDAAVQPHRRLGREPVPLSPEQTVQSSARRVPASGPDGGGERLRVLYALLFVPYLLMVLPIAPWLVSLIRGVFNRL